MLGTQPAAPHPPDFLQATDERDCSHGLSPEIALLLCVAVIDVATRSIANEACLALAQMGIASRFTGPTHIAGSPVAATILLLLLFVVCLRGTFF